MLSAAGPILPTHPPRRQRRSRRTGIAAESTRIRGKVCPCKVCSLSRQYRKRNLPSPLIIIKNHHTPSQNTLVQHPLSQPSSSSPSQLPLFPLFSFFTITPPPPPPLTRSLGEARLGIYPRYQPFLRSARMPHRRHLALLHRRWDELLTFTHPLVQQLIPYHPRSHPLSPPPSPNPPLALTTHPPPPHQVIVVSLVQAILDPTPTPTPFHTYPHPHPHSPPPSSYTPLLPPFTPSHCGLAGASNPRPHPDPHPHLHSLPHPLSLPPSSYTPLFPPH